MGTHIIVIDEGTSSTRVIAYGRDMKPVASAQYAVELDYPNPGWVEQDAAEVWRLTYLALQEVVDQIGGPQNAAAIGIANQRETTIAWDKASLEPLMPAIVWQDRRTANHCEALRTVSLEKFVLEKTGLLLDPYFSATKMGWLLNNSVSVQEAYAETRLAMGTVDSWLIANLTEGRKHVTDVTNASRTLLMDLRTDDWSTALLDIFKIPRSILPETQASGSHFGECRLFGHSIPILSSIGDQQAALFGQGCVREGEAKITYGTGAFLLAHTGDQPLVSRNKLLSTRLASRTGEAAVFGLEGAIFNAGNIVKWLRDSVGLVQTASQSEVMAAGLEGNDGVYVVPAFTGLGAPHWRPDVQASISGLTWGTGASHIVRAGLEAVAYQTRDLLNAFEADGCPIGGELRIDGGMVANDWLMQFVADICGLALIRPEDQETTARGSALMAALELGWIKSVDDVFERGEKSGFVPSMSADKRTENIAGWNSALGRLIS